MAQYTYISLCWNCGKVYTNDTIHFCEVNMDNPVVRVELNPTRHGVMFDIYYNDDLVERTHIRTFADAKDELSAVWDRLVDSPVKPGLR